MKPSMYLIVTALLLGLVITIIQVIFPDGPIFNTFSKFVDPVEIIPDTQVLQTNPDQVEFNIQRTSTEAINIPSKVNKSSTAKLKYDKANLSSLIFIIFDVDDWPVSNISVVLLGKSGNVTQKSQFNGETAFLGINAGSYSYRIDAPNSPVLVSSRPIKLLENEEKVVKVHLKNYEFNIEGFIINQNGEAVEGIEISARRETGQIKYNEGELKLQYRQRTRSDDRGFFSLINLPEGEYQLHTLATDTYRSVKTVAHTGRDAFMMKVLEYFNLRIAGQVTNPAGEPLSNVRVIPVQQAKSITRTNTKGQYHLTVAITDDTIRQHIDFHLQGYQTERIELNDEVVYGHELIQLDATLEPMEHPITVTGYIIDEQGRSVSGQRVHLHSQSQNIHYQTRTESNGQFVLTGVSAGPDYRLWVRPKSYYKDYLKEFINLSNNSEPFEIQLESISLGNLTGQMVDTDGNPVPNISFTIYSVNAHRNLLRVTGDADGNFKVDDVPEGLLVIHARARPKHRVRGIKLDAGESKDIKLVFDWGDFTINGRVVDEQGRPLSGVTVNLYGSYIDGKLHSESVRNTTTDTDGIFIFNQLGRATHHLSINLVGYHSQQRMLEKVTESVIIQLKSQ